MRTSQLNSCKMGWYELTEGGESRLDLLIKGVLPQFEDTHYVYVLYDLLNSAVHNNDAQKVKLLLGRYKADPNTDDVDSYNARALFVTVFEKKGENWEEILMEFIRNGADYRNHKCYMRYDVPFINRSVRAQRRDLIRYVETFM